MTSYVYLELADRSSQGAWEEEGSLDIMSRAQVSVQQTLSTNYPDHIDTKTDATIRASFPIKLKPEDMRSGNGRW